MSAGSRPPEHILKAYLQKIKEWEALGYHVEGLEDLLYDDFEKFKEIEERILRGEYETLEKNSDVTRDLVLIDLADEEEAMAEIDVTEEMPEKEVTEAIKEVITEEPVAEEEIAIVKAPSRKKVKRRKRAVKRKKPRKVKTEKVITDRRSRTSGIEKAIKALLTLIAIAILALSMNLMFPESANILMDTILGKENVEIKWYFPSVATSGQVVIFDARNTTGNIKNYTWDFGDGSYGYGAKVWHHYTTGGQYTVVLTVRYGGGEKSRSGVIYIKPLTVRVPERRIGDLAYYTIKGYINISNPNGIYSGEIPSQIGSGTVKITVVNIDFKSLDGSSVYIQSTNSQEDGFGAVHNTLPTETKENLDLKITVKTSEGTKFTFTGNVNMLHIAYEDLYNSRLIKSKINTYFNIKNPLSSTPMFSFEETATIYPVLKKEAIDLSINTLRENRTFSEGDEVGVGGYNLGVPYAWNVIGADNINGFKCLKIRITPDTTLLNDANIDELTIYIWVSAKASLPVKTYIRFRATYGDNTTEGLYIAEMYSFRSGDNPINWGTCSFHPPSDNANGHYYSIRPGVKIISWNDYPPDGYGKYMPPYTLENAVSNGKLKSSGLVDYLTNNPLSYVVFANLTQRFNGTYIWNVIYGTKAESNGYMFAVNSEEDIEVDTIKEIDPPMYSRYDINRTISISEAIEIFSTIDTMVPAFSDSKIDFKNATFEFAVTTMAQNPSISSSLSSFISMSIISQTPACYYTLRYNAPDGRILTSTIDANTGEIISIITERITTSENSGGGIIPPLR